MGPCFNKVVSAGVLVRSSHAVLLTSDSAEGSGNDSDLEKRMQDLVSQFQEEGGSGSPLAIDNDEKAVEHSYFSEQTSTNKNDEESSDNFSDDVSEATTTVPMTQPLPSGRNADKAKQVAYDDTASVLTAVSQQHADLNAKHSTIKPLSDEINQLFVACRTGDAAVVKRLREYLKSTPDINSLTGQGYGNEEATKLRHGTGNYHQGVTPLILASIRGHVAIVKELLAYDAIEVNKQAGSFTALFHACEEGHSEVVTALLLHKDSDVNYMHDNYGTPLIHACAQEQSDCVSVILAHPETNVNLQDGVIGDTALMKACDCGHADIVSRLLDHTAIDVNVTNYIGQTALVRASESYKGHADSTQDEITRMSSAREEIVKILKEHIAKSTSEEK